jgi:predicted nuclease of restriction endonuclease-like (RecB) superfamily
LKDGLKYYSQFLDEIKKRIRQAQTRAVLSANAEMILMYWDIGRMIDERQRLEGWGAAIIPRLSRDIRNELPDVKGFSERNIGYMIRFTREYPDLKILQPSVAKNITQDKITSEIGDSNTSIYSMLLSIPWAHNILLMEKIKEISVRKWYIQKTIENGWSRDVLRLMISNNAFKRQGKAVSNFNIALPSPQSDLVQQALKDPYVFDFLTLTEPFQERELETGLMRHLQKFLVELGQGFAFVGKQYHLVIGDEDFYVDLLFYHLKLRCFIVIDLKKGDFRPEYAGKMNFYCSAVDDLLIHESDNPTIGLILCQKKNRIVAEYTLRGFHKPIGISEYELTRSLPEDLKSSLPSIEEIEAELSVDINDI